MKLQVIESTAQKAKAVAQAAGREFKEAAQKAKAAGERSRQAKLKLKQARKESKRARKAARQFREAADDARTVFAKAAEVAAKAEAKATGARKKAAPKKSKAKANRRVPVANTGRRGFKKKRQVQPKPMAKLNRSRVTATKATAPVLNPIRLKNAPSLDTRAMSAPAKLRARLPFTKAQRRIDLKSHRPRAIVQPVVRTEAKLTGIASTSAPTLQPVSPTATATDAPTPGNSSESSGSSSER